MLMRDLFAVAIDNLLV